jgi:predicted DNA-binding antitoxin AbrB/MazE fold protein
MALEVEATYEDGVLKLDHPLPFPDRERIVVSLKAKSSRVDESYGLIGWTGDPAILRRIAEDDEASVLEAP